MDKGFSSTPSDDLFVFPQNVHEITSRSTVGGRDYLKIGLLVWVLANGLMLIIGVSLANNNSWGLWIPLTIQAVINAIGLTLVLRFGVFKEAEKEREMKEEGSQAFNRYCKVRSLSPLKTLDRYDLEVPIYQYANGAVFSVLKFTHGTNNNTKSRGNAEILTLFYRHLAKMGINHSTYIGDEDFSESKEARAHIRKISECEDDALANTVSRLTKAVYDIAKEESNVECMYLILKGKGESYSSIIENSVFYLQELMDSYPNSFRNLEVCGEDSYIMFIKDFNSLGGIDTARIKIENFEEDNSISTLNVRVYMVEYPDGQILLNEKIIESQLNKIKRVN